MIRHKDLLIVQTSDPDDYIRLFNATSPLNRAYAHQHGFDYYNYIGIKRGRKAWLASWNKMYLLNEALGRGEYSWLLYMDADAWFWNRELSLMDIVDPNRDKAFIFCAGTHEPDPPQWNVNNGVFFANLNHPKTREVAAAWHTVFQGYDDDLLEDAAPWDERMMRDQQTLHTVLEKHTDSAGKIEFIKVYEGPEHNRFNYSGPFIRQALRSAHPSMEERLRQIQPGPGQ